MIVIPVGPCDWCGREAICRVGPFDACADHADARHAPTAAERER